MINDEFENRKYIIGGLISLVVIIYVVRLFSLQILDDTYQDKADSNAYLKRIEFPSRGLIKDRNGKTLVFNKPAYDIMMVVREMNKFDTLSFCKLVKITKDGKSVNAVIVRSFARQDIGRAYNIMAEYGKLCFELLEEN